MFCRSVPLLNPIVLSNLNMNRSDVKKQFSVTVIARDVKFGIKTRSDWPKMGQIWDFLGSISVHFGSPSLNVLKLILRYQICLIWGQSDPILMPNLTPCC